MTATSDIAEDAAQTRAAESPRERHEERHEERHRGKRPTGYVASVGLALLLSGWLAALVEAEVARRGGFALSQEWVRNLEAGFFLAIAFGNPVGVFLGGHSKRGALVRAALGLAAGVLVQHMLFTPLAGGTLSRYLLLLLAALVLPLVRCGGAARRSLERRGVDLPTRAMKAFSAGVCLPARLQFVLLMTTSFALAYLGGASVGQLVALQAAVLLFMVLVVSLESRPAFPEPPESAEDPGPDERLRLWLAFEERQGGAEPAPRETLPELGWRLREIGTSILPAAVLFGTMMMIAVHFLGQVYPNLRAMLVPGPEGLRPALVAVLGSLAVVFFGMMAALGLGLSVLRLIGWLGGWPAERLRDSLLELIRLMYFRPMRRG